jgi:hypothetical protein
VAEKLLACQEGLWSTGLVTSRPRIEPNFEPRICLVWIAKSLLLKPSELPEVLNLHFRMSGLLSLHK